jgi:hypothetical protein
MTIVKASTYKGKRLKYSAEHCTALTLGELYNTWSYAKEKAYQYCREMYCADETACNFGLGSANTFGFSASWYCEYEGKPAYHLETPNNSYVILLNE